MGSGSAEVQKILENTLISITIAFLIVPEICFQKFYFGYPCPLGLAWIDYFLELPLLRPYCAFQNTCVADVFVCGTHFFSCLASGAWRGGKRATQYAQMTTVCEGKPSPIFLDRGFLT